MLQKQIVSALLVLAATQAAASAEPKVKPEIHALSPQDVRAVQPTAGKVLPAPVHTGMQATLLPDGSIELRCDETHEHPQRQNPEPEQAR